jgi:hypothetical protein
MAAMYPLEDEQEDDVELPTALLTSWGSFADKHLEDWYRREYINPGLQKSLVLFVLGLWAVVSTLVTSSWARRPTALRGSGSSW